jgi:hypothetical protein
MGTLTHDMTRLRGEITVLRESRHCLISDMAQDTAQMKNAVSDMRQGFRDAHGQMAARLKADQKKFITTMAADVVGMLNGFHKAHRDMAAKTKKANTKFVSDMATGVAGMLAGFHKAQLNMAKSSRAERSRFVSQLEASVSGLRQEVADDLAGARRAWRDMPSAGKAAEEEAKRKARQHDEARAKADADLRAKEHAEHKARVEADMKAKKKTEKDKPEHTSVQDPRS